MFEAVGEHILVQIFKREKTQGGLVLPSTSSDPQAYGVVLSFGGNIGFIAEKGDYLVFHPRGGMDVLMEKRVMKVLKSNEIYGILTDEKLKEGLVPLTIGE
jgi:co-chaperonin GroES (HSP10)